MGRINELSLCACTAARLRITTSATTATASKTPPATAGPTIIAGSLDDEDVSVLALLRETPAEENSEPVAWRLATKAGLARVAWMVPALWLVVMRMVMVKFDKARRLRLIEEETQHCAGMPAVRHAARLVAFCTWLRGMSGASTLEIGRACGITDTPDAEPEL